MTIPKWFSKDKQKKILSWRTKDALGEFRTWKSTDWINFYGRCEIICELAEKKIQDESIDFDKALKEKNVSQRNDNCSLWIYINYYCTMQLSNWHFLNIVIESYFLLAWKSTGDFTDWTSFIYNRIYNFPPKI